MINNRALIFLADGFEEIETITPIDLLKRAGIEVFMASITGKIDVVGAHQISLKCDILLEDITLNNFTIFILPGGPGHKTLASNNLVCDILLSANSENKLIAAICAAPSILGNLGLLKDKNACCFTGFENALNCKEVIMNRPTVTDGNIITSRGAGTAFLFGCAIIEKVLDKDKTQAIKDQTIYMA